MFFFFTNQKLCFFKLQTTLCTQIEHMHQNPTIREGDTNFFFPSNTTVLVIPLSAEHKNHTSTQPHQTRQSATEPLRRSIAPTKNSFDW